ncbi:Double-strand-specific pac1 ribonuclease [Taphrina deformans PYCC 5710]|uniref:ribonuclease III n=1 Tax=Taphrina deformans (strain PYCC 5710 / ATCC 11124 / CBS 356.35 / IMI 108563 / JCM 9778 / NBRC 8474) TaxID=1097556 RepID=R4XEP1_TAPDE|nr:Double-strand-specific pac1 ribonuclease [Taphrina deformans PYCC 5710]|eukprot:CCG82941.1 Double-strand-specific pac1 ribonuclease [Taphrina deformans PYCC 5710]
MTKRMREDDEETVSPFDKIVVKFNAFVSSLSELIEATPEENFSTRGLSSEIEDRVVIAKVLKRMYRKEQLSWMDQYLEVDNKQTGATETNQELTRNITGSITQLSDDIHSRAYAADSHQSKSEVVPSHDSKWPPSLPPMHDQNLLKQAFTHRSYATACAPAQSTKVFLTGLHNERLEFLGDSFLNHSVTKMLFSRMPESREGEMSLLRAELIGNNTAAAFGKLYDFDKLLLLNNTAEKDGVRKTPKVIADTFEAYLGALILDGPDGVIRADSWLKGLMAPRIREYLQAKVVEPIDVFAKQKVWNHFIKKYPATTVHEDGVPRPMISIKYDWVDGGGGNEGGFIVAANLHVPQEQIEAHELGRGFGLNKKEAEHRAAMDAVSRLGL